jgi:hypothetical protein
MILFDRLLRLFGRQCEMCGHLAVRWHHPESGGLYNVCRRHRTALEASPLKTERIHLHPKELEAFRATSCP